MITESIVLVYRFCALMGEQLFQASCSYGGFPKCLLRWAGNPEAVISNTVTSPSRNVLGSYSSSCLLLLTETETCRRILANYWLQKFQKPHSGSRILTDWQSGITNLLDALFCDFYSQKRLKNAWGEDSSKAKIGCTTQTIWNVPQRS